MLNTRKIFNIITLGDVNVGKTSIINRFINEKFDYHVRPTLITDIKKK